MPTFRSTDKLIAIAGLLLAVLLASACSGGNPGTPANTVSVGSLRDTPAVRLNLRYEGDVPAPTLDAGKATDGERNTAIQSDFDTNRPQELIDRTVASPDAKHVAVVYHRVTDVQAEFRLDIYTPDGKLLKKATSDTMAVHFPETLV